MFEKLTMGFAVVAISSSFIFGTDTHLKIPRPNGEVVTQIQVIARSMDEVPLYYVELAAQESSTNPMAANKRSSALGLFQFIDSTWGTIVRKYGKQYELSYGGRTDVRQSTVAVILFTRENRNFLSSELGRDPTNKELYLAHHFGLSATMRLLNADPGDRIDTVLSRSALKANPHLKGRTVSEAIKVTTRSIS